MSQAKKTSCCWQLVLACVGAVGSAFGFAESASIRATSTAAVNTGYYANPNSQFTCDYRLNDQTIKQWIFGNNESTLCNALYINGNRYYAWAYQNGGGNWTATTLRPDYERHIGILDSVNGLAAVRTLTPNGTVTHVESKISTTRTKTSTTATTLFACATSKNTAWDTSCWGTETIYSLEIREKGVLKKFFAPYSDGTQVGFKEILSGTVCTNCGTGGLLVYSDGVGRASDYTYANSTLFCKVYASASIPAGGSVAVSGGTAAEAGATWVPQNTSITLTATAHANYRFLGWSGDVEAITSGDARAATITVTPAAAKKLVAAFVPKTGCAWSEEEKTLTLTSDQDWRPGLAAVPHGCTINLNGHKLSVSGTEGPGAVVNSYVQPQTVANATPAALANAVLWFDAADASTLTLDANGAVSAWTSKGTTANIIAKSSSEYMRPVYEARLHGRPTVDFGKVGNGKDMSFTRLSNLRTIFWVIQIEQSEAAFLLGDSSNYNFHRSSSGYYFNSTYAKTMTQAWNGLDPVKPFSDILPKNGFQVIAAISTANVNANQLAQDRSNMNSSYIHRSGGRQLSEVIAFSTALGDADREAVTKYLQAKWNAYAAPDGGELHVDVAQDATAVNESLKLGGTVKLVKDGAGTFTVRPFWQPYSGGTTIAKGTLQTTGRGSCHALGAPASKVRVEAEGTFDLAGQPHFHEYSFTCAGGTLHNSVAALGTGDANFADLTLEADSRITGLGNSLIQGSYSIASLQLNGHTLTVDLASASAPFILVNSRLNAGTLFLKNGTLYHYKAQSYANETHLIAAPGTTIKSTGNGHISFKDLVTEGDEIGGNWISVDSCVVKADVNTKAVGAYRPYGPHTSKVTFTKRGKGVTEFGVSHNASSFTGGIFVEEGGLKLMDKAALGSTTYSPVTISKGGWIDYNGKCGANGTTVKLAGAGDGTGAIINSVTTAPAFNYAHPIGSLTLTDDAAIGGVGPLTFLQTSYAALTWTLGTYTLTKSGTCRAVAFNTTINGTGAFVVAEGTFAAGDTVTVNAPLVVKTGAALDLSIPYTTRTSKLVLNGATTFEPGTQTTGSGATLVLNGTCTGLANVSTSNVQFNASARLVLTSAAPKVTFAGTLVAAGTPGVIDATVLFANGEPSETTLTILETGSALRVWPTVEGVPAGWNVQYGAKSIALVKGTPTHVFAQTAEPTERVSVSSATQIVVPADVAATITPGVYTIAQWTTGASGYGAPMVTLTDCAYETELICSAFDVKLIVKDPNATAYKPVKIWTLGDHRVGEATYNWRIPLAQKLAVRGWNPQMTGFRTTNATDPSGATVKESWRGHTGFTTDTAFKMGVSGSTYTIGLLQGIDTYAAAAQEPDFTILSLGTFCYWTLTRTGEQAYTNWLETCNHILTALPQTTLIVTTIPNDLVGSGTSDTNTRRKTARTTFNTLMRAQCAKSAAEGGFPAGRVLLYDVDATVSSVSAYYRSNFYFSLAGADIVASELANLIAEHATPAGRTGAPALAKIRATRDLAAKTLAVTFTKPITAAPATATLAPTAGGDAIALADATLSDDGRTVTYTLGAALGDQTDYTFTCGAVSDYDGTASAASLTTTFTATAAGAGSNVPAAYTTGFRKLAVLEPQAIQGYAQSMGAVPYSWREAYLPASGITKAGYYIAGERSDTGEVVEMWIDFDAPGGSFADISLPVTLAQSKQQVVNKLHVWTTFGGVQQVAATDDSVSGMITFHPINYTGTAKNYTGAMPEIWKSAYDWNDTLTASGTSGHGIFSFYRCFGATAEPAAETLFGYSYWGNPNITSPTSFGFGTLSDNKQFTGNCTLNWTFAYGTDDRAKINSAAYKNLRIEFWAVCDELPARADSVTGTWQGPYGTAFATPSNWVNDASAALTTLLDQTLLLPAHDGDATAFTYIGYDPISLKGTTLLVDGAYSFPAQGAFYLRTLDLGATGKLVYDPARVTFRFGEAPCFASGAKIALTANYAAATKGRFLLFTYDRGTVTADDLNAIFDASSAAGANVRVWSETLDDGSGRLWLDLDATEGALTKIRVMPVGDSITQGSDTTYGNWRIPLMKKLSAAGYDPTATGMWSVHSADETGATMPENWIWHSGVSGRRLLTKNYPGVEDAIENEIEQAGNVDVLLMKIGTNDINSDGTTAEDLFVGWTNTVRKILAQSACKLVCGAVVNIADTNKNAKVTAFNTLMKNAIEGDLFPAGRVYFADLYTACPRYDSNGTFITGSFQTATDLHPDWPGEDLVADEYARVIQLALADGLPTHPAPDTTAGCENNVPAAYRAGFTRVGTWDMTQTAAIPHGAPVPYANFNSAAPTQNLARVGYYIELKRKDTAITDYGDRVRWMWVDLDAFGDRDLASCGIPIDTVNQCRVTRLHVASNMPGIDSVAADDDTAIGFVEFWPWNYDTAASALVGAPAATLTAYDWNDTVAVGTGGAASMQVHRIRTVRQHAAQTLFSFNRFPRDGYKNLGLGTFAFHPKATMDWTWTSREDHSTIGPQFDSGAYEVARLEIWTKAAEADETAYLWRPATAQGVVSDAVAAWQKAGDATLLPFLADGAYLFDGADTAANVITTAVDLVAQEVTITGAKNYTFAGPGQITADTLVFAGDAGTTITLNGAGFASTNIEIRSGVVALGASVEQSALGADLSGVVTIRDGAAFDFAFPASATYNTSRYCTLADKLVHIAGAGPDGKGVLRNTSTSTTWCSYLSRVYLDADATIGGTARVDLRNGYWSRKYSGRSILYGPDYVLTDAVAPINANYGLDLNNCDATLKRLEVAAGARLCFEGTVNLDIAEGVWLREGASLDPYGATVKGTGTIHIPSGVTAYIQNRYSNTYLYVPVDVEEGATLIIASGTTRFAGGITGKGQVKQTSGGFYIGETDVLPFGGSLTAENYTYAGGTLYIGEWNGAGSFPTFDAFNVTSAASGTVELRTSTNTVINGETTIIRVPNATLQVHGPTSFPTNIVEYPSITVRNAADWAAKYLLIGIPSYMGNLILDGGKMTVGYINLGQNSNARAGRLVLENGAKLSVTNAYLGTGSAAVQVAAVTSQGVVQENQFIVNDATLDVPNGYFINGWSGRYARFEMNEGSEVNIYGVVGRRRYNGIPGTIGHDSIFQMNGGTLGIGPGGFMHGTMAYYSSAGSYESQYTHANESGPVFRLNNGTLRATADTVDSNSQRSPGVDIAFGDLPENAGAVTIDTNGKTLDLRTGLKGWSDVRVTGTGTLVSSADTMGIVSGLWTVDAGVTAQLDGAAGFAGGLVLEAGAAAQVNAKSTSLVEAYVGCQHVTGFLATNCCTHYATSLYYLHRTKHATGPSYRTFGYRGEFYVPEDKAGTWYFYGQWDDYVALDIDGVRVLAIPSSCKATSGSKALTAGWHRFTAVASDGYGSQGPTGWSTTMGIGYRIGSSGGSTAANYKKFDTDTLLMRPPREVKLWHKSVGAAWTATCFDDFTSHKPEAYDWMVSTNTTKLINNSNSVGDTAYAGTVLKLARNRLNGVLYVPEDQVGVWNVKFGYDDVSAFMLDGVRVAGSASYTHQTQGEIWMRAGYHTFDIFFGDTTGGYGLNGVAAIPGVAALAVSVNGASYVPFDEDSFQIGVMPFIGLAGDSTLKAGSTLTNAGAAAYPITGTLWGDGTLSGLFAYEGGWLGAQISDRTCTCPKYANANAATFANLAGVRVRFTGEPTAAYYRLGPAGGLTRAAAEALPLDVAYTGVDGDKALELAEKVYLTVRDDQLTIVNPQKPATVIFLR